ncbi:MAG: hypothetical protein LAO56_03990 [Acidobacteriia bacterium]|nr:hypothetical protein [Terriglobia bacterium]
MKFAAAPKFALPAVLVFAFALTGCGFLNSSSPAVTAGNWSFIATSTVTPSQISHLGGSLAISGSNVSSTMHSDLPCYDVSAPFSFGGTLQNKQITFTSPANASGQVVTVIASVASPTAITGSYTVTAGGGCPADQGTITAARVPSMNGTWTAPIVGSGGSNVTLSMALTQASTASADGTYALTGNLTYANSTCSLSGTVTNSYLAGTMLVINGATLETDSSSGDFEIPDALLNNSSAPTSFKGTYSVVNSANCAGDTDTPTFTKQ